MTASKDVAKKAVAKKSVAKKDKPSHSPSVAQPQSAARAAAQSESQAAKDRVGRFVYRSVNTVGYDLNAVEILLAQASKSSPDARLIQVLEGVYQGDAAWLLIFEIPAETLAE